VGEGKKKRKERGAISLNVDGRKGKNPGVRSSQPEEKKQKEKKG